MNNFLELQLLPMMEISFNILPRVTLITFLLKCLISPLMFFSSEECLLVEQITKKDTMKDKDINISSLK